MDEGTVREYNHHKIFTVEQLANLKETSLDNLGLGARTLHTKAKAFVAANKDSKVAEKYAAQNEALTKQVEDLSKIVKEQSLKLDALEKANKKKK
jgi:beta-N-acetylglucosaminidase